MTMINVRERCGAATGIDSGVRGAIGYDTGLLNDGCDDDVTWGPGNAACDDVAIG